MERIVRRETTISELVARVEVFVSVRHRLESRSDTLAVVGSCSLAFLAPSEIIWLTFVCGHRTHRSPRLMDPKQHEVIMPVSTQAQSGNASDTDLDLVLGQKKLVTMSNHTQTQTSNLCGAYHPEATFLPGVGADIRKR